MRSLSLNEVLTLFPTSMGDDREMIIELIKDNKAEAFALLGCNFITCFEHSHGHKYLVVMCAEGKNVFEACEEVKKMAKGQECSRVRFFTERRALARVFKSYNWTEKTTMYECNI